MINRKVIAVYFWGSYETNEYRLREQMQTALSIKVVVHVITSVI
jgi:hypothetical protein